MKAKVEHTVDLKMENCVEELELRLTTSKAIISKYKVKWG